MSFDDVLLTVCMCAINHLQLRLECTAYSTEGREIIVLVAANVRGECGRCAVDCFSLLVEWCH